MESYIIQLENITKTFNKGKHNEVNSVKNINLNILPQSCTILKGASGSGKSTLLSILGCLTKATNGSYCLLNKEVTHWSEKFLTQFRRKHIGIVFQQFQLIPDLTIFQNIALPLLPLAYSSKEIDKKVRHLVEKVGLQHRLFFKVKTLSGGEMQRVAIARALILEPTIVLADEPTAHLDSSMSAQILAIFNQLKKEGKTIILTTHDARVEQTLAIDHTLLMEDGEIYIQK